MDFILDNPETEKKFQRILELIKLRKNGEISDLMSQKGLKYRLNWGVSLVELRSIAVGFEPDHLLALKLWNRQWRETMIMSAILDEHVKVTEEQMDLWTKSFENTEIAEIFSTCLWVKSKFAFIKALEWCRGKKQFVRFTGIHLMGRLAISDKKALDEMFEPFFDELTVLSRDAKFYTVIYRTVIAIANRSKKLNALAAEFAKQLQQSESVNALHLGETLYEELTANT
ncbi:MAG: hypothetical protein LBV47_06225 [Bacteroidales bacterium]|jgi:hypothetical protein|nr:hypothetical protein [Bacteroidales bacterium]